MWRTFTIRRLNGVTAKLFLPPNVPASPARDRIYDEGKFRRHIFQISIWSGTVTSFRSHRVNVSICKKLLKAEVLFVPRAVEVYQCAPGDQSRCGHICVRPCYDFRSFLPPSFVSYSVVQEHGAVPMHILAHSSSMGSTDES